jgi:DNA sulfur modification protein DndD
MRLESVRLSNWKGYRRAELRLPAANAQGNVVVIRGANGAGKTSLLEAIVLGLFGRHGLGLVGRAAQGERREVSYDGFLERALNTDAQGREVSMSVELEFAGGEAERLVIKRVWYFSAGGRHRRDDEDVRLMQGEDWEVVPLPDGAERDAALHDFVGQKLLAHNLAPFFVFDGEHIDRMAGQNMETQVRAAADLVLGGPELRGVAADLRAYARDRRRDTRVSDNADLEALRANLNTLEADEQAVLTRVEAASVAITPVRAARDDLVRRIGALHGDSYASFKALFEEREGLARRRAADQEQLRQALSVDLALALSGSGLRTAAQTQIAAEALLDQWEAGQGNSQTRYEAFLSYLSRGGEAIAADLDKRLRRAWDAVWRDPPEGIATARRHTHLGETDRHLVARHLEAVSLSAGDRIADLARRVEETDAGIVDLEDRVARQRGLDEQSQALADQLRAVQEEIAGLEAQHRLDVQDLDRVRANLVPLRQEVGRLMGQAAALAPMLRRADKAEAYAAMLDRLVVDALPRTLQTLATNATAAYRAMAHKDVVQSIRIGDDGVVELLDSAGRDICGQDASAGETQVFALALMAAVAGAFPNFPILMDTPFARLDTVHRRNVLRHFADLGVQLVLLAHPAELTPTDLAELGDRFAGEVEVHHVKTEGLGSSRILPATEALNDA